MVISKLIAANKADEGNWLDIKYEGKPLGMRMLLVGKDSQVYRRHYHEMMADIAASVKKGENSQDLTEKQLCRLMAHCCIEWEGFEGDDKKLLQCTFENVLEVFEHSKLRFITDQATQFVENRSNFLSISPNDSQAQQENEPA